MLLDAKNLSFSYGVMPVLQGVDLALAAGELVALLGPNGSGKSTLLRVLLGHLRGAGEVRWDGTPVHTFHPRDLAKTVAYLAQTPTFDADATVADVLRLGRAPFWGAFGLESADDARVVATVAEQLALTPLLDRQIDELSGGQRQRVFLGRCLAQQPAAILLDEPSTYLDLQHQVSLIHLLRGLAQGSRGSRGSRGGGGGGLGVLMASHDLNLALAVADRVVLLHHGIVAFNGPPDAISAELLSTLYAVPMTRLTGPAGRPVFVPALTP